MKKLILFLSLLVLCSATAFGQKTTLPPIYEDAAALGARYQLSNAQQAKLQKIIATRQANLEAIAALQTSDQLTFWKKRKAVYIGQQAAIERLLETKTQKQAFAELKLANRIAESELMRELLDQGHSREEVRLLVIEQRY